MCSANKQGDSRIDLPQRVWSAYDAGVATQDDLDGTLQILKTRIAALEASKTDLHAISEAIKAFGDTQQMLADVLRGFGSGMRATADDSNQRIRSLEASVAEIKNHLAQALNR